MCFFYWLWCYILAVELLVVLLLNDVDGATILVVVLLVMVPKDTDNATQI